jgi:hypothetical protein
MEDLEEQERNRVRKLKIKGLLKNNDHQSSKNTQFNRDEVFTNRSSNNNNDFNQQTTLKNLSYIYGQDGGDEFAIKNTPYRLPKLK